MAVGEIQRGDPLLVTLGVVAAALSVAFAGYAVLTSVNAPELSGTEHLLIFTRPSQTQLTVRRERPQIVPAGPESDPLTTGSIKPRRNAPAKAEDDVTGSLIRQNPRIIASYSIRGIFGDKALLQGPDGFVMASTGIALKGAGLVKGIEEENGRWTLRTSEGVIADASQ